MLKGLFSHVFAKVVFVISTYLIHLYLGKSLSAIDYGTIGVVISIITVNYNFLSNGARQAVSKLLASKKYNESDLIKKSIATQMSVAMILTALNFWGADYLAELLNAPSMADYIRLAALMIPFTAGHFICVGTINGLRLFVVEATIVTIYPLLRLSVIPYVRFLFSDSAIGTVAGFFTASAVCCVGGLLYLLKSRNKFVQRNNKVEMKTFFSHMTNFLLFFTCITVILNADMLFVNALVTDGNQVGYYTGAVNFAKVSYYLLSAIYIVVLPVVTKYYFEDNIRGAKDTIKALNNAIMLFILPIVSIVGASSGEMLAVFYKPEYASASTTATILMCSQFLIGLFVVVNMCISATKDKKYSTIISVILVIINMLSCVLLVKPFGIIGAAVSSLITGAIGCFVSYIKVGKIFGLSFDKSTAKLLLLNVVLFGITKLLFKCAIYVNNLFALLLIYATIYFLFVGLMIITRQLDIKQIISILKKK